MAAANPAIRFSDVESRPLVPSFGWRQMALDALGIVLIGVGVLALLVWLMTLNGSWLVIGLTLFWLGIIAGVYSGNYHPPSLPAMGAIALMWFFILAAVLYIPPALDKLLPGWSSAVVRVCGRWLSMWLVMAVIGVPAWITGDTAKKYGDEAYWYWIHLGYRWSYEQERKRELNNSLGDFYEVWFKVGFGGWFVLALLDRLFGMGNVIAFLLPILREIVVVLVEIVKMLVQAAGMLLGRV